MKSQPNKKAFDSHITIRCTKKQKDDMHIEAEKRGLCPSVIAREKLFGEGWR